MNRVPDASTNFRVRFFLFITSDRSILHIMLISAGLPAIFRTDCMVNKYFLLGTNRQTTSILEPE